MTDHLPRQSSPTIDDIFDAIESRLVDLGEPKATAAERASFMINNWEWYSDNSVDDRGRETARDGMDPQLAWLLDQSLNVKYGLSANIVPPADADLVANALDDSTEFTRWLEGELRVYRGHTGCNGTLQGFREHCVKALQANPTEVLPNNTEFARWLDRELKIVKMIFERDPDSSD